MSHFEDLTPYCYDLPGPLTGVFHVGWLEPEQAYQRGEVPEGFGEQLRRCLVQAKANQIRGFQVCRFCYPHEIRNEAAPHLMSLKPPYSKEDQQRFLDAFVPHMKTTWGDETLYIGSAEIWVPGPDGQVFAAPTMIVHYVEEHGYRPPDAFIAAVMNPDALVGWDADREYNERTAVLYK